MTNIDLLHLALQATLKECVSTPTTPDDLATLYYLIQVLRPKEANAQT